MPTDTQASRNWFNQAGQTYVRFRPEYPPELSKFLATIVPSTEMAVDVGCGNGQLTGQLGHYFDCVIGVDSSADQIANAPVREGIRYICAPAEMMPLPDNSASLITAAQAVHWFNLPDFFAEVRRIAIGDAIVALISYGVLRLDPDIHERFSHFYWHETGPYWPAERKLVDTGYAGISFPFDERLAPAMEIRRDWELSELLGYISTWSAVRRIEEVGREDILKTFSEELADIWGAPQKKRPVVWPINMRLGTV